MTSTRNESCAAEIVALHQLFETWLGAPGEGDFARFGTAYYFIFFFSLLFLHKFETSKPVPDRVTG